MRKLFVLIFLLSIGLLGCQQEGEELVTKTAVSPQPTATTVPTMTPAPTIVVTETAVSTATNTLEPTITSTNTSSYQTPQPPSSVPEINVDTNYVLVTPSTARLLQVMEQSAYTENMFREQYTSWTVSQLLYPLLFADISKISIDEFPNSVTALTDSSLIVAPSHIVNWIPSNAHFHVLKAAVLQYLNQNKTTLVSGEKIEEEAALFFPIKLEGISKNEQSIWLVHVESRNFRIRTFLLFGQNTQGNFTLIGEPLLSYSLFSFPDNWLNNIYSEYDVTGDGIKEIIIETGIYYSGTGTETVYDVFSWHNDEMMKLEEIRVFQMDAFEIADQTGDGIDDLQTINNYYRNFGCEWAEIDTYSWPNQVPQHIDQDDTPPDTAVCNLGQAVQPYDLGWHPNKDENYPILTRVVSQLQAEETTLPDLLAYALSQLAFAYVEQGSDEQARTTINQIYSLPTHSSYAQYIQQNDTTGSVIDLCRNLNINANKALNTAIGDFLNENAARGRGFDWREPAKAYICDLNYIVFNRLKNINLPSSLTPVDAFAERELQFDFADSVNLDGDPELEWIGILEPATPRLVILDDVNGVWNIDIVNMYSYPITAFDFAQQDVTADGQLETIIALTVDSSYSEPYHIVLLIGKGDEQFEIIDSNSDLEAFPDLNEIDVTYFELDQPEPEQPSQPEWELLIGLLPEERNISAYIQELTDTVIVQTNPDIPNQITDLLNYLPTDDPEAQPYREHLTYLLGYHYELRDEEEEAVNAYLDLIKQNPSSPWAWLAWARLEPE